MPWHKIYPPCQGTPVVTACHRIFRTVAPLLVSSLSSNASQPYRPDQKKPPCFLQWSEQMRLQRLKLALLLTLVALALPSAPASSETGCFAAEVSARCLEFLQAPSKTGLLGLLGLKPLQPPTPAAWAHTHTHTESSTVWLKGHHLCGPSWMDILLRLLSLWRGGPRMSLMSYPQSLHASF